MEDCADLSGKMDGWKNEEGRVNKCAESMSGYHQHFVLFLVLLGNHVIFEKFFV